MILYYFDLFGLSLVLFGVALWGLVVTRRSVIMVLISLELLILALNVLFLSGSLVNDDVSGQLLTLFVLTVAAAEASIGLAILVVYYRLRGVISLDFISALKG